MAEKPTRDVHVRLCVAAARGKGVRLTADEVWMLCRDAAIPAAAMDAITGEGGANGATPEDVLEALKGQTDGDS